MIKLFEDFIKEDYKTDLGKEKLKYINIIVKKFKLNLQKALNELEVKKIVPNYWDLIDEFAQQYFSEKGKGFNKEYQIKLNKYIEALKNYNSKTDINSDIFDYNRELFYDILDDNNLPSTDHDFE